MEIGEEVFVFVEVEEFAADFHRDDLFIRQSRFESSAAQLDGGSDEGIMLNYQTVDCDDKTISIQSVCPPVNGLSQIHSTGQDTHLRSAKKVAHKVKVEFGISPKVDALKNTIREGALKYIGSPAPFLPGRRNPAP